MPLLGLLLSLLIFAVILWLLLYLIGMIPDASLQKILRVVVVVFAVIVVIYWLAALAGGIGTGPLLPVPHR